MGASASVDLPELVDRELFKTISGDLFTDDTFDLYKNKDGYITKENLILLGEKLTPRKRVQLPPLPANMKNLESLYDDVDIDVEKEKMVEKAQAVSVGFSSFKKGLSRKGFAYADQNFIARGPRQKIEEEIVYSPDAALLQKIELQRKRHGPAHYDTIATMHELADLYIEMGEYEKVEAVYLDMFLSQKMNIGKTHDDTLATMLNLAKFYIKRDLDEKAERLLQDCLDLQTGKLGEDNPETLDTMVSLANVYSKQMKKSDAEKLYLKHFEFQEIKLGLDPATANGERCIKILKNLVDFYDFFKEPLKCEFYRVKHRKITLGDENNLTIQSIIKLATLYMNTEDRRSAEPLYVERVEILRRKYGPTHEVAIGAGQELAKMYVDWKEYPKTAEVYEKMIELFRDEAVEDAPFTLHILFLLSTHYDLLMKKYPIAEALYIECISKRQAHPALGPKHKDTLQALKQLSELYDKTKDAIKAETTRLELKTMSIGRANVDTLNTMHYLAQLYDNEKSYEAAEPYYRECYELRLTETLGAEHNDTIYCAFHLALMYTKMKDRDDKAKEKSKRKGKQAFAEEETPTSKDSAPKSKSKTSTSIQPDTESTQVDETDDKWGSQDFSGNSGAPADKELTLQNKAQPLYEFCWIGLKDVKGVTDADSLQCGMNLCWIYYSDDIYDPGYKLHCELLAIQREVHGSKHALTLTTMKQLVKLYLDHNEPILAEVLQLEIYRTERGNTDNKTLRSMYLLACLYDDTQSYEDCIPLYEECLTSWRLELGIKHKDTLMLIQRMGIVYRIVDNFERSEELLQECIHNRKYDGSMKYGAPAQGHSPSPKSRSRKGAKIITKGDLTVRDSVDIEMMISEMTLTLSNMRAEDLIDTGTNLDPQDPVLHIRVTGTEFFYKTERQKDASTSCSFHDEICAADILPEDYLSSTCELVVEVFNESSTGSETLVGRGRAQVCDLLDIGNFNMQNEIEIELEHIVHEGEWNSSSTYGGKIIMTAFMNAITVNSLEGSLPDDDGISLLSMESQYKYVSDDLDAINKGPKAIKAFKIKFDYMEGTDLYDTGTYLDPQDPSMWLQLGSRLFNTERRKDAKTEAIFTGESWEFEVETDEYEEGMELSVQLFNESVDGSKIHIGKGSIKLAPLLVEYNKKVPITIDLHHHNNKTGAVHQKGKAKIRASISAVRYEDGDEKGGILEMHGVDKRKERKIRELNLVLDQMRAVNLVDTGSYMDPQDPALYLKLGDNRLFNTARAKDARTDANFHGEVYEIDIDMEEYDGSLKLEAEVFNETGGGSKLHIGKGGVRLSQAIDEFDKHMNISFDLMHTNKKGESFMQGKIYLRGYIRATYEEDEDKKKLEQLKASKISKRKSYSVGEGGDDEASLVSMSEIEEMVLKFDQMRATNLVDTGNYLDPQDPALTIRIGEKTFRTARQKDAKTEANFEDEAFDIEVDPHEFKQGMEMEVEVFNESDDGTGKAIHVGKGRITLKDVLIAHNKNLPFKIELFNEKKKIQKGVVFMRGYAQVKYMGDGNIGNMRDGANGRRRKKASANEEEIPIKELVLRLDSMRANNLVNLGTFLDAQDPALLITVGDKKLFATKRQQDAGTDATFTGEVYELSLHPAEFDDNLEVEFEVVNQNAIGIRQHIGKQKVSLKKLIGVMDKHVWFQVDLVHHGKKKEITKGTVYMRGRVETVYDQGAKGANDKTTGEILEKLSDTDYMLLKLDTIEGHHLVDTGSLTDPQDPRFIVKYKSREYRTSRHKNGVTTGIFTGDEIKIKINPEEYANPSNKLEMEVVNEDIHGFRKHVGLINIPLRELISHDKLNVKIPIELDLLHQPKKGKKLQIGRIIMHGMYQLVPKKHKHSDPIMVIEEVDTLECIYQLALLYKTFASLDESEDLYYECLAGYKAMYGLNNMRTLQAMWELSEVLEHKDSYETAEPLYQELIECEIQFLGVNHDMTQSSISSLSRMYAVSGDILKEGYFILKIQRLMLGNEHLTTLETMIKLGLLLLNSEKYAEAEPVLLECLELRQQLLGLDATDTLTTMRVLADLYYDMGSFRASEFMEVDIMKQKPGRAHEDTLHYMNELAIKYSTTGAWDDAEIMYMGVLDVQNQILSPNHPHIEAHYNLLNLYENVYQDKKGADRAEALYLKLIGKQKVLLKGGDKHPEGIETRNKLAKLYYNLERYDKAIPHYQVVLNIETELRGESDEVTLESLFKLARSYFKHTDYQTAQRLFTECQDKRRELLGEQHPDTILCLMNLGRIYFELGDLTTAEKVYLECISAQSALVGEEHPDTLASMDSLAVLYTAQAKIVDATRLNLKVSRIRSGNEHYDTMKLMLQLGLLLSDDFKKPEARELLDECYSARKKILGKLNPDTLTSMEALGVVSAQIDKTVELSEGLLKDCIKGREKILGKLNRSTLRAVFQLGRAYDLHNKREKSLEQYNKALTGQKTVIGWRLHPGIDILLEDTNAWAECNPGEETYGDCTETMVRLADLQMKMGDAVAAENLFVEVNQHLLGVDHEFTLRSQHHLASAYAAANQCPTAEILFENCLRRRRVTIGVWHPDSLRSLVELAVVYDSNDKFRKSEAAYREAIKYYVSQHGLKYELTLDANFKLASLYLHKNFYGRAVPLFIDHINGCREAYGSAHPTSITFMLNLADLYEQNQEFDQAEILFVEVLNAIVLTGFRYDRSVSVSDMIIQTLDMVAGFYKRQKQIAQVKSLYRNMYTAMESALGPEHVDCQHLQAKIDVLYPEDAVPRDPTSSKKIGVKPNSRR